MEKKELAVEIVLHEGCNYYQATYLYTFDEEKLRSSNEIISALKIDEDEVEAIVSILSLEKRENKYGIYYASRQRRKAEEYDKKNIDRMAEHFHTLTAVSE